MLRSKIDIEHRFSSTKKTIHIGNNRKNKKQNNKVINLIIVNKILEAQNHDSVYIRHGLHSSILYGVFL